MTRRRWIADQVDGDRAWLRGAHAQHLTRVLRVRVGQTFDVATGETVRRGTIVSVADDAVEFALGEQITGVDETEITLLLAIFKFDRMEWAIEKCVELGVAKIIPLIARRTESHLAQAAAKRVERWRRIAVQASEQSRRLAPPHIADPRRLTSDVIVGNGSRIVLSESEQQVTLVQALAELSLPITLAIGPEGGWSEAELKLFADAGWRFASLGSTILRAETAAIAALAICRAVSG